MQQSLEMPAFGHRTHASYAVRVRGTMFLWGSAGVTANLVFNNPILLHVRNNVFGEVVTLGTQTPAGQQQTIGTLQPGQVLSIPIQNNIAGVFATCALETNVDCLIQVSHS